MDAKHFDALLRALTNRSSRRGIGLTLASFGLGATFGVGPISEVEAKKCPPCRKKKRGKCKRRKPTGTPCEEGRGICDRGSCSCGDGPTCPPQQVCVAGHCFPQGTCPEGTRACVPETGTACGDDCFCALSAEGNTVCIESGGLCIQFSNCETAAACSTCQTTADCTPGEACIDISGCCEGVIRETPLPAGTKTCASPCITPDT
jgi:hypothetical protein